MSFKLEHRYSCGHSRTYWVVRRRRAVVHEERCAACQARATREVEAAAQRTGIFAVRLNNVMTNVRMVIAQSKGLEMYRGRE